MNRLEPRASIATILALILLLVPTACAGDDDSILGKWQLDSYVANGTEIEVIDDINTQGKPYFEFDEYVWGYAGCNNFGDNGDYEYIFASGVLSFLEVIPKDASQCVPDELMSVELFLEEILWSNSEITVDIERDSMTWEVGERSLHFSRTE